MAFTALAAKMPFNQRLIATLATTIIDLFVVAGQSNAQGQGLTKSALTPTAGTAFDVYNQTFNQLADSVGGANIGSAWPKYCTDYYTGFTRKVAILDTSVAGSAQSSIISTLNWDTTGSLYPNMVAKIREKIQALKYAGVTVTLRGILWCQGERDANEIDAAALTKAQYKAALNTMIGRIQTDFPTLKLYISRTGTKNTGDTTGFSQTRAAQDEVTAAAPTTTNMAFTDAVNFAGAGKMSDTFHYTTTGLQEMGAGMAASVIADNPSGIVY